MSYIGPYQWSDEQAPVPPTGTFPFVVCTTAERLQKMVSVLLYGGVSMGYPVLGDHNIDVLEALGYIHAGYQNPDAPRGIKPPCQQVSEDVCRWYIPAHSLFTWPWFDPFDPDAPQPTGWNVDPLYVATNDLFPGVKAGDVVTDQTRIIQSDIRAPFGGWPRFTFSVDVQSSLKMSFFFVAVPGGGQFLINYSGPVSGADVVASSSIDIFGVGLDDILDFVLDWELATEIIHEIELNQPGTYDFTVRWVPTVGTDSLLGFGGAFRGLELCGDVACEDQMIRVNDLDPCLIEQYDYATEMWVEFFRLDACHPITAANATTLPPGNPATASIVNTILELGIPRGADGEDGTDGLPGQDCECGPPDTPDPPTRETDADALCGASYYIANQLRTIVKDLIDDLATFTILEMLESLIITQFVRPGWRTSFLKQLLYFLVITGTEEMKNNLDDRIDEIACALYCSDLGKEAAKTEIQKITGWNPASANAVNYTIDAIDDGTWSLWAFIGGTDTSKNCVPCGCGWCYTIDFTVTDGGFILSDISTDVGTQNLGVWQSNTGWVDTEDGRPEADGGGRGVGIHYEFNQPVTFTRAVLEHSSVNTSGRRATIFLTDEPYAGGTNFVEKTANGATTDDPVIWDGNQTASAVRLQSSSQLKDSGEVDVTFTRLTLYGTGTNPFGADNCDEIDDIEPEASWGEKIWSTFRWK